MPFHSICSDSFVRQAAVVIAACGFALQAARAEETAAPSDDPEVVSLFDGKSMAGWRGETGDWQAVSAVRLDTGDNTKFTARGKAGVLFNGEAGKTVNLLTEPEFGDINFRAEFCVPKGSNSGVYFMGRYEIQVLDSYGKDEPKYGDNGGIYKNDKGWEGKPPARNVSRAPGEWQSFDVVFRAPRFDATGKKTASATFLKVVHNGTTIHENVEVNAPTIAAAFSDEAATGPLMLQGDHGPVAYRNLRVKKLDLK